MAEAEPTPEKKFPMKMLIILGVALVIEAAAFIVVIMLSGGPSDVQASDAIEDEQAKLNAPAEVPVIAQKFQNTRSGQPFLYDTEIYITVKKKHEELITEKVAQSQALIGDQITTIFRRAEPAHLNEPDRQTLKRQVHAALDDLLGTDPDGEKFILEVIIPTMKRFSTDI